MATVYKAHQASLDRYVAVKVLPTNPDPQFAARFKREARAIAQLQHPNILPVYDYGEQDGLLYLVVQYIENGTTLGDLLGTPMEPVAALRITERVLSALDYAHQRGIIHRDIKPSNILMPSPTWPLLADFGIAKLMNASEGQALTMSGVFIGTPAYVAPEQAFGARASTAAPTSTATGRGPLRNGHRAGAVRRRHADDHADQARLRAAAPAAHDQPRPAPGGRAGAAARAGERPGRPLPEREPDGRGAGAGGRAD